MTRMPNNAVILEVSDQVATITLDRPESLNSMTNGLMDDLRSAVGAAEADPNARVVVLTGNGRGFCSGADLGEVPPPAGDAPQSGRVDPTVAMDNHFHPAIMALKNCGLPTIARVNGAAAGGGLGLAMTCDVSIAARSAFFASTFGPRLGIVPDLGTTWSLPMRAGRAKALGMAMLGDRITAEQAEAWGLIYKVVDDAELDTEVARSADILKRSSPAAVVRMRTAIETAGERPFEAQLDVERDHQKILIPMNMGEGAAAFLEKRDPVFDG